MADSVNPPPPDRNTISAPAETKEPSAGRKLFSRIVDVALWIAVIGVVAMALLPKKSGPNVGQPATQMELPVVGQTDERRALLADGKKPLLIEAFASWCGACRRNSGLLHDLDSARRKGKLDVVAVSVDDRIEQALAAKNQWPIPVDVYHDEDGRFARTYHVDVLPTYILIGADGRVQRVTSGNPGASDIRAWLNAADD